MPNTAAKRMVGAVILHLIAWLGMFSLANAYSQSSSWYNAKFFRVVPSFSNASPKVASRQLVRNNAQMSARNIGNMIDRATLSKIAGKSFTNIGNSRILPPNDGEDEWRLWFTGRDSSMDSSIVNMATGSVYFMTSKDGVTNWQHHPDSPILKPSKEAGDWWWYDAEHIGLGDVLMPGTNAQSKFRSANTIYIMYTFGGNSESIDMEGKPIKGLKIEIGVAVSQDGIHWSKVEGKSAYSSILQTGSPNDFDGQFVGWPSILETNQEFRMYYHTYDPRSKKFIIGLAIANDGLLDWAKVGAVFSGSDNPSHFDSMGATRRHVVRLRDGKYRMWYEGVSSQGKHSIGLASSDDGIKWTRVSDDPVFAPSEDPSEWDSGSVGSPHLVWLPEKQRWRLYYVGSSMSDSSSDNVSGGGNGIGIAESLDETGTYFHRVSI